jgi:hypothetical protein
MSLLKSSGIWTHAHHPRAICVDGDILVGSVAADGDINVTRLFTESEVAHVANLDDNFQVNSHATPALLKLSATGPNAGKILVCYAAHNGAGYARVGKVVGGVSTFDVKGSSVFATGSYAQIFQTGNTAETVYWFYRPGTGGAGTEPIAYRKSTDGGLTWGSQVDIFSVTGERPYPVIRQFSANRLDFFTTNGHPNEVATSIYHFYMQVASDGTETFYKSDGTQIMTALPFAVADVTQVYDGTTDNAWGWDLASIGGTIYGAFVSFANTDLDHTYHRATLSAGTWSHESITDGGTHTDDNVVAAENTFSPGICFDQNAVDTVLLGKVYSAGNIRLEKWIKSAGTWGKSADVSGNTSSINISPVFVKDYPTTQFVYLRGTYTTYLNYATDIYTYPDLTASSYSPIAKPSSPVWQTASAPSGCKLYLPFHEGSGTSLDNLCPSGGNDGTFVGALTWGSGEFGPQITGWSTTKYITIDPASQILVTTLYPFWVAALINDNTSTSEGWVISQRSSTTAPPLCGLINNAGGVAQTLQGAARGDDNVNVNVSVASQPLNDGNPHVLMLVCWSSTLRRIYVDGVEKATATGALGAMTANNLTIGVARGQPGVSTPYTGAISAIAAGNGAAPDPGVFADDWLSGRFSAVRVLPGNPAGAFVSLLIGGSMGVM